jgi:hypothetical protein
MRVDQINSQFKPQANFYAEEITRTYKKTFGLIERLILLSVATYPNTSYIIVEIIYSVV